ncbi:hypothetical protein I4U23_028107 [Adineta vaga]|nr:hypothetical protein I4U23_028107 [Adineta vaga]
MFESMDLKRKSKARRSIGQWCQDFWSTIDRYISSLRRFIYNREQGEICGRDGKRWSKLAAFYFFFFITLAGFFCLYLSIFMSLLPLNQPKYIGKSSCLTSRVNSLSPGLSFRPQPEFDPKDRHTVIRFSATNHEYDSYVKNLDEFLNSYYSISTSKNFTINNVGNCQSDKQYGFSTGQPCFLIKINKIVDFVPEIGRTDVDNKDESACVNIPNIPVRCQGEVCSIFVVYYIIILLVPIEIIRSRQPWHYSILQ